MLEAFHEKPDFVIGGRVKRTGQVSHTLIRHPFFSRRKERPGHFLIIDAFEKSPRSHAGAVVTVVIVVHNCGYSPHRFRTPPGKEQHAPGKLPVWMFSDVQHPAHNFFQGRHPIRVVFVDFPRQVYKSVKVRGSFYWNDLELRHYQSFPLVTRAVTDSMYFWRERQSNG